MDNILDKEWKLIENDEYWDYQCLDDYRQHIKISKIWPTIEFYCIITIGTNLLKDIYDKAQELQVNL